jgi:hypothetical protein
MQVRNTPLNGKPIFEGEKLRFEQLKVRDEAIEQMNFNFFFQEQDLNTPKNETIANEIKNEILNMGFKRKSPAKRRIKVIKPENIFRPISFSRRP